MIILTVLILSFLVALNFFLLIFSCNKTPKNIESKEINKLRGAGKPTLVSNQLPKLQLAATGS